MGGIFKVCGIGGFLENLDEFYGEADTEDSEILPFIDTWWETEKSNPVTAADLYDRVCFRNDVVLDLVVPEKVRWLNKGEGFQRTLATAFSSSKHNHSTSH
jgi:hypothetical protein